MGFVSIFMLTIDCYVYKGISMNYLFWLGQIGIVFEIAGAGYIVYAAFQAHKNLKGKSHTIDAADVMETTMEEVRNQYKKELIGFSLLAVGLVMQFIGGFSV